MNETNLKELLQLETSTWDIYGLAAGKLHITENELWILLEIFETDPPLCQADIARHLHLPVQTINSALSKMKKKGWLELISIKNSSRSKGVVLTEQGAKELSTSIRKIQYAEQSALDSLGEENARIMLACIRQYNARLKEEMETAFS